MAAVKKSEYVFALAAGIFLGAALFDAFPEASRSIGIAPAVVWLGAGLVFWWVSKIILRRFQKPEMPPLVASALWFHSALEGIVTGLAFGVSRSFGLVVLSAMILHLLPEFFAAVALMRASGSAGKASCIVTLAGYGILFASFAVTYFALPELGGVLPTAIALSGGAFFYIGVISYWRRRSWATFPIFLCGVAVILVQSWLF